MGMALGIRAEPVALHWAVVDGSTEYPVLIACGTVQCPKTFEEAGALGWLRKQILSLINEYTIAVVGLRTMEPIARGAGQESARRRARMEGVIMESTDSAGTGLFAGALTTIGRQLNSKHPKGDLAQATLRGLDWSRRTPLQREAILVGVAALKAVA
jgi:hypothetical protein